MKIGRNDPCPCGSGKKYKKCCINLLENLLENNVTKTSKLPDKMWQKEDVQYLDNETIFNYLQTYGIPINKKSFITQIKAVHSAEDLIQQWIDMFQLDIQNRMIDFTFLAIKVLARRLTPEHILIEQIDDLIFDGYELDERGFYAEKTTRTWIKAWEMLLKWIDGKNISSIDHVDEMAKGNMTILFSNWIQDFDEALQNASGSNQQFQKIRKKVAEQFLELFPNSSRHLLDLMNTAMGQTLFHLGEREKADSLFRKYTKKHPTSTWVYIHWGDLYNPELKSKFENIEKAAAIYQEGTENALDPHDAEDALDRLHDMISGRD